MTRVTTFSRAQVGKLEAEGVIERQGDGRPLDRSRIAQGRLTLPPGKVLVGRARSISGIRLPRVCFTP